MKVDMSVIGNNAVKKESLYIPEEGQSAARFYQTMRDVDPVIGGVFAAIESMFKQVEWFATPQGDTPEARAWAEFLTECLKDMSQTMPSFIGEALSMLHQGWSYHEVVYKVRGGPDQTDPAKRSRYSDNKIGWRKFAFRPQTTLSRWEYDADGGVQGMWQSAGGRVVFIPIQKALHFKTADAGGHPEGRSLLTNARRSYRFQSRLEEFEAVGVERDLAGLPHVTVPPDLLAFDASDDSEEARAARATLMSLEQMAGDVRNDTRSYVLTIAPKTAVAEFDEKTQDTTYKDVSTGYGFSLLSSGGQRAHDTDAIIKRHAQRIGVSLLANFLLLGGSEGKGAQSLSNDLTRFFFLNAQGILDGITAVLNAYAVAPLMRLNGVKSEFWPTLENSKLSEAALNNMLDRVTKLTGAKLITPDTETENYFRRALGLPEKTPEQAALDAQKAKDAAAAQPGKDNGGNSGQDGNSGNNQQDQGNGGSQDGQGQGGKAEDAPELDA